MLAQKGKTWGTWLAHLVKRLPSAHVMIEPYIELLLLSLPLLFLTLSNK